jgi:hypothetical protein
MDFILVWFWFCCDVFRGSFDDEVGNHEAADEGIDKVQTTVGWRPARDRQEQRRFCAANCAVKLIPIPKSHEAAIASEKAALWNETEEDEMTSLA